MAVRSAPEQAGLGPLAEALLDRIHEAVFLADTAGRLRYVNRRACQLLGYARLELLSLDLCDIDGSLPAGGWPAYRDSLLTHLPRRTERFYRVHAGFTIPLEIAVERFDFQGDAWLMFQAEEPGAAGDEAQDGTRGQAREFRLWLEQARSTMVRWDRDSRVVYMNRAMEQTLGVAPAAKLGTRLLAEQGPEWSALQKAFIRVLQTGRPEELDLKFWQGPALRVEHAQLTALRGGDGQVAGVLMIGQDVTERSMNEAVLRESERHYRHIFEHLPDGIYLLEATEEGRFRNLDMNPALARSLGVTAEELIGRHVDEGMPGEVGRKVIAKFERCMAAGTRIEEEIALDLTGGTAWYHSTLMPVRDASGRVHRIVGITRDITRQKRMDMDLRESERRYRDVFDNTLDGIILVEVTPDNRFRVLESNAAFERATGFAREVTTGRLIEEVVPEAVAQVVNSRCAQVVESGAARDEEVLLDLPAGMRVFHTTIVPMRDGVGRIYRLLGITRDITDKREMELVVSQREKDFRSLAENLPDNIIRYDRDGKVVYVNPMMANTMGLSPESLLGRSIDELPATAWTRRFLETIQSGASDTGAGPEEIKVALRTPDGEERTHQVRFVTERDEHGAVTGTLSIGRDITALERAAALLHARAEAFRAVVENSPDIIARYDREVRRIFLNPAMERLLGRPAGELLGTRVEQESPLAQSTNFAQLIREVFERREELQGEFSHEDDSGVRWGHLRVVPEFAPDGTVVSVLAVGRDITGLKEAARELQESRAEVRELAARREMAREEERKRIAREMHDELGQLLMALRLDISIAGHFAGADPVMKEKIAGMMGLVDRTSRVVRDLVADLRPAALDMGLGLAIEWLASDFEGRRGVHCDLQIAERDLQLSEERSVALFRIVQESLTNVARHAQAGQVTIALERRGGDIRLEVRDDGKGFDPAAPRKNSFGLLGVRERAMALGGSVTITSAPGAGTRVEVIIPEQTQ